MEREVEVLLDVDPLLLLQKSLQTARQRSPALSRSPQIDDARLRHLPAAALLPLAASLRRRGPCRTFSSCSRTSADIREVLRRRTAVSASPACDLEFTSDDRFRDSLNLSVVFGRVVIFFQGEPLAPRFWSLIITLGCKPSRQ